MKLLIDTNIFIPLEPTQKKEEEINTLPAVKLIRLTSELSFSVYIHPLISEEIRQDKDVERRELRKKLIGKYPVLPNPPQIANSKHNQIFHSPKGSHDWIDDHLLRALEVGMVNYLITEDKKIHIKATKLSLSKKVLTLNQAIQLLENNIDELILPPPSVVRKYAHELSIKNPFFNSLKSDYGNKDFAEWYEKCIREHRHCYLIQEEKTGKILGLSILKREDNAFSLGTKVLKICLFKISEKDQGNRLGELLLKAVFEYCEENKYEGVFLTVKPVKEKVIKFIEGFGFFRCGEDENEVVYGKKYRFSQEDKRRLSPFDFHVKYGPGATKYEGNNNFIIPIKPKYYYALFPEAQKNLALFPDTQPYGNSIKKIYISRSRIRGLSKGNNIIFYVSEQSVLGAVGIIENVLITGNYEKLKKFVKNITVYHDNALMDLVESDVIAIQFRRVKIIKEEITINELKCNKILKGVPQSITKIRKGKIGWLEDRI